MQSRVPCLVMGTLSLLLSRLAGAQDYLWTEIVIPGATIIQAFGLNDIGQVAVSTTAGSGIYENGTLTRLPPLKGFAVTAVGINNDGVITGDASTPVGTQGFVLRGSTYTLFSRAGWDNTAPRAIANSGLITGHNFSTDLSRSAGFIYDPDGDTFTDATPPGSIDTLVQGMNKFGRITGHGLEPSIPPGGRYGIVWQQRAITNCKHELLPFLERLNIDFNTYARGINDSGLVVGFIRDAAGRGDGFVGSDALGYQRLVPPGGEVTGNSTFCAGINNFAQVVCYVWDSASNPQAAFIGSPVERNGKADK